MDRAAKALAEKNMRDLLAQKEQAEKNRLSEALDADIKRWSSGKEGNLRALLSTLQYILGPGSGWQPISLTDIVTTNAVKKAYRKATLSVHPDKLQQRGASIQQKYICEKVFDLLKAAWNKFDSEESNEEDIMALKNSRRQDTLGYHDHLGKVVLYRNNQILGDSPAYLMSNVSSHNDINIAGEHAKQHHEFLLACPFGHHLVPNTRHGHQADKIWSQLKPRCIRRPGLTSNNVTSKPNNIALMLGKESSIYDEVSQVSDAYYCLRKMRDNKKRIKDTRLLF
ncbi:hypothetical protein RJ640_020956 [Escallonia rubra]|uniref:J domain-containing protein n=1 Tax=Escallonia rubra TaxID=112253 RepID=A0AA88S8M6_9ASTE|nr:hypothetical protein RJ640_020956 [Escallonia rubra]